MTPTRVTVTLRGEDVGARFTAAQREVSITLDKLQTVLADQELNVMITR